MTTTNLFLQPVDNDLADLYYCHWQSVLAGFQQLKQEIRERGISKDIDIINFDDFADIKDYPMTDFLILRSFQMDSEQGELFFSFNVGISTYKDANNHRLGKLVSYIAHRYMEGRAQYVLDENGDIKATLTFTDQGNVNPMSKAELRSTQFITVVAKTTATAV